MPMKRLPLLLDHQPSPLVRAATYLLVPIVLVVALPILLLLILVLYLAALLHGAKVFVFMITGTNETAEEDMQKPHFLERQASASELPDESAPTAKG